MIFKDVLATVTAYFNGSQRQATKDAGANTWLNVLGIINEPTAVATDVVYGLDKDAKEKKLILILYLDYATFNDFLLSIDNGFFEVKASSGNTHLGEEDFHNGLINFCF